VPTFAAFRTELAQRRRMLYVAIGPAALREVAAAPLRLRGDLRLHLEPGRGARCDWARCRGARRVP
jgi:hypothetical protein